ncbi:hypothetical protein GCM10027048_32540 [Hymenobacter coalescens]
MNVNKLIKIAFLLVTALCVGSNEVFAQSANTTAVTPSSRADSVSIYINQILLSPSEDAAVLKALTYLSKKSESLKDVISKPNTTLDKLILSEYNIKENINNHAYKQVLYEIKSINKISNEKKIQVGDTLKLPVLPKKSELIKSVNYTQFVDPEKGLNKFFTTASFIKSDLNAAPLSQFAYQPAFTVIRLDSLNLVFFKKFLPKSLTEQKNGIAYAEVNDPEFVAVDFPASNIDFPVTTPQSTNDDTDLINLIKNIDKKYFGKYIYMDFFNDGDCKHGEKVFDVMRLNLEHYGLNPNDLSLIPVPVNYFKNEEKCLELMKKLFTLSPDDSPEIATFKVTGQAGLQSLIKLKKNKTKYEELKKRNPEIIPELYLIACIRACYGQEPDVLASSFFSRCYGSSALLPFEDGNTSVITACLNDNGTYIESFLKKTDPKISKGATIGKPEPLFAYFMAYEKSGSIIVGCAAEGQKPKFRGMYSQGGDYVTTLGKGYGWVGKCIQSNDIGASFATPDVGTKVLIAKAYWKSVLEKPVSALKTRHRVVLATDIDTAYAGRFASAGVLNLRKLMQASNGYCETITGSIKNAKIEDGSYAKYNQITQSAFHGKTGIGGIYFSNNEFYVYLSSNSAWTKVNMNSIHLLITIDSEKIIIDNIDDFKTRFKQVVSLKNL